MPGKDRTGPMGQGEATGRGLGDCETTDQPVNEGLGQGRGLGCRRGLGRANNLGNGAGRGQGRGPGRGRRR